MSRQDVERLDDRGIAAWEEHDAEAFVALLAEEFVWNDWTLPEPIRDRAGAVAYFQSWMTAFPDMLVKQTGRVVSDDAVAGELEFHGTNTGPIAMGGVTIPPTGKIVAGRGSYVARVRAGKVVEFSTHPDVAGLLMQLGILAPPA